MQLENEHPLGWGVVPDDAYFVHLNDEAVKLGLEVPHFMSGLHHGAAPTPPAVPTAPRTDPWFSTEFWSGWFDLYGPLGDKKKLAVEMANWTIMARGGGGHNFYMIHGGTDFDTWNDASMGASYDYGAAIGQAGDLRPIYYQMKRANQLAQSFPEIVGDSADVSSSYHDFVTGPDAYLNGARQGPGGTLVFLQNKNAPGNHRDFPGRGDPAHGPFQ